MRAAEAASGSSKWSSEASTELSDRLAEQSMTPHCLRLLPWCRARHARENTECLLTHVCTKSFGVLSIACGAENDTCMVNGCRHLWPKCARVLAQTATIWPFNWRLF